MTAREIDIHTLPSMLTAVRLPSFHKLWAEIAARADTEGWPAARFLAVLAEYELAERDMRRIRRHLTEAQLPTGKTLATFDFKALPSLPRSLVAALAAGDWLEGGGNLIAIGNSGPDWTHGKTHVLCAIGHALVEAGHRVVYTRTSDLVQKLQVARRDLALAAALAKLDRFDLTSAGAPSPGRLALPPPPRSHHLCPQRSGRDRRPLRADRATLRIPQHRHCRQPTLQRLGPDLPRPISFQTGP